LGIDGRVEACGAPERYERKGNIVSTEHAQARLAEIRSGAQTSPT
jgi:hypothetical protein